MAKNLIRWSPFFEPLEDMEKNFFDLSPSKLERDNFMPAIDMYEEKNNIIVETDLAGIDTDNVDISVDKGCLTIRGEGEKKQEVDEKNYYKKEIRRGGFYRSIPLPDQVDGDSAKAIAQDGVLKVTIPKVKESKAKNIKIEKKGDK